jgi:hypothetical protein
VASWATNEELRQYLPQITVTGDNDDLLDAILLRATGIVRDALRSLLADPTFDYAAYGAASAKIVRAYDSAYLSLPAYQLSTVTLVEYQSGSTPSTYTTLTSDQWEATASGSLYRASGWYSGNNARYRITAVWGYGPVIDSARELVLELAVNIWRSKDKGGFTEIVGVDGSGAIRAIAGLNPQQVMILENIRNQISQVWV